MAFPALLFIDGFEFTDDGRTINANVDKRETEIELANGTIKKYRKAVKHKYSISWDWLPGTETQTSDGKFGRDKLVAIAMAGDPHICQVRIRDTEIVTFAGYIESYQEDLIRRDFITDTAFYSVKMDLREA